MTSSLSVSKVRLAFECPRLLYLGHHSGGMTMFLPAEKVLGIGSAFHQLSDQFVRQLRTEPEFQFLLMAESELLKADAIAQVFQQRLYQSIFFPYLQQAIAEKPEKAQALHQLWQGLKGLIQRWADLLVSNRRFCKADEVMQKTFLAQELSVKHEFTLPDGSHQLVKGRFDSLVYDFTHHRLCVVEYKTYQSPDPSAQLAQVALYSYMLREKIGVPIDSAVYSVLPDWQEQVYSWAQLENTVHQLIPQKLLQIRDWLAWQPNQGEPPPAALQAALCDMCPQRKKCQTYFSSNSASTSMALAGQKPTTSESTKQSTAPNQTTNSTDRPLTPQNTSSSEVEAIANQLVRTLESFGVGVDLQGIALAPAFLRVKLKPQLGVKVNSILRLTDDLRVQLGLMASPMIAPQAGYVSVDLPRPDRQSALFKQYIQIQTLPPTDPVRIAIGVNLEGDLVEADLSDPNTCHFLVGGTTGSGKSEFLRSLLLSLLKRHPPKHLQIALVDPKRVTFPEFEDIPWLLQPIVKDTEGAIALMNSLMNEMDQRYRRFEKNRCADLTRYNQQSSSPLPRIVCIFDEYADFMAEKESRSAIEQSIKRLGAMARAAGIHLIIATQRPDAQVVTPLIRSNLPGRVALKTASEADSLIILGGKQGEAVNLLGKGDLLYLSGGQLLRLQSLFAPEINL
ncbi:DNA translocase FtsK [Phormidium tenue]|uniref:Cell division protein FtsK n=1 Tax=Phormidium tenue NIES-30 TaxID=549789 RepID=A0A1U7J2X6_9CYAN|nr:DNA translocase FtsK [Phormidium tenue]MBD2233270.1 PD-(D/E)XK nuclease family protein [Phormidium tenue FACHB-1052]OKH46560.1 cell division protein FtsK [Phormidium tenue NIES-30]